MEKIETQQKAQQLWKEMNDLVNYEFNENKESLSLNELYDKIKEFLEEIVKWK